ncbi:hypothetical protein BDW42DRAFT_202356 [Aspergillus taichungensis]|uniref:DUF6536 domain-containing protein n=1 Tax=Aspergillus taichungensis TaxID=482145 RepID=A0A2J5I6K8_9EURO|nr:hypothetical protein BDW42DRAFT_202356 [Aspergillus taichungensis]
MSCEAISTTTTLVSPSISRSQDHGTASSDSGQGLQLQSPPHDSPGEDEKEPSNHSSNQKTAPRKERQWTQGVLLCIYVMIAILAIHLSMTVIFALRARSNKSRSMFYQGDCDTVNGISIGLALLINAIGVALTATSNYCCQIVTAPSREEVDWAHNKRTWVAIGSQSMTNIWLAAPWRKVLWLVLCATSIAIQLVYNSFVHTAVGANDFGVVVISTKSSILTTEFAPGPLFKQTIGVSSEELHEELVNKDLEKMGEWVNKYGMTQGVPSTCKSKYDSSHFMKTRLTLVIASDDMPTNKSTIWKCTSNSSLQLQGVMEHTTAPSGLSGSNNLCDFSAPGDGDDAINGYVIHDCWSKPTKAQCQMVYNFHIGLIVTGCVAGKLISIILIICDNREEILLTTGDAIASFLRRPDPTTADTSLLAHPHVPRRQAMNDEVHLSWRANFPIDSQRHNPHRDTTTPPPARPTYPCRKWYIWKDAVPRLLLWLLVTLATLSIGISFVPLTSNMPDESGKPVSTSVFSGIFPPALDTRLSGKSFACYVLVVNSPQVVVSMIYYLVNNALTRMLLAAEYSGYAIKRKPLRVSFPEGHQRSTYYLTIPYRWSVPTLVIFSVLHLLMAEAFSFMEAIPYSVHQQFEESRSMHGIGLSIAASGFYMGILVYCWMHMYLAMHIIRFDYPPMPLALNCSAAISAACHPPESDTDAAEKPVMWGEVQRENSTGGDGHEPYRYCSFSSQAVEEKQCTLLSRGHQTRHKPLSKPTPVEKDAPQLLNTYQARPTHDS